MVDSCVTHIAFVYVILYFAHVFHISSQYQNEAWPNTLCVLSNPWHDKVTATNPDLSAILSHLLTDLPLLSLMSLLLLSCAEVTGRNKTLRDRHPTCEALAWWENEIKTVSLILRRHTCN